MSGACIRGRVVWRMGCLFLNREICLTRLKGGGINGWSAVWGEGAELCQLQLELFQHWRSFSLEKPSLPNVYCFWDWLVSFCLLFFFFILPWYFVCNLVLLQYAYFEELVFNSCVMAVGKGLWVFESGVVVIFLRNMVWAHLRYGYAFPSIKLHW